MRIAFWDLRAPPSFGGNSHHYSVLQLYDKIGATNKSDGCGLHQRSGFISPTKLESSGMFSDSNQSKICHVYRRTEK